MHRPEIMADTGSSFALEAFFRLRPEKRAKVQNAAISVFAARGYDGAGMQEIAGKAGISVGAIYRYFKSKEDLFLYIASLGYSLLHEIARSIESADLSLRESIHCLFRLTLDYSLKYPELSRVYLNLSMIADLGQVERLNRVLEGSFLELYRGLFEKARARGEIPPESNLRLAAFALDNQLIMLQHALCSSYYRERRKAYLGEEGAISPAVSPGAALSVFLPELEAGAPSPEELARMREDLPGVLPDDLAELCLRMFLLPEKKSDP